MFVNCSNHPSNIWSKSQMEESRKWGEIKDYSFPYVAANTDEKEIERLAQQTIDKILEFHPDAVMCQGEFTLTYAIVKGLKTLGIEVVSACSEREVTEKRTSDGGTEKISYFRFLKYRKY